MKIVFIIASLEGFGGTNRVATLLANRLADSHQITILSKTSLENTYSLNNKVKAIKFTGNDFSFVMKCKQYISQHNPDRVIIHTMSKLTPAILLSGVRAKQIWSLEHIAFEFHSRLFKFLRKRLYKKLDRVITLTRSDAANYKNFYQDVNVVQNPNPLELVTQPNQGIFKTLISIGRLTEQKGYDQLITAWSLVENEHPNWSLHIYGEGEEREKLEQLISIHKLKNIHLKGLTTEVQSVYDNAAFYVMSSRFEGLPVVLIEAQSRGLPIVSFDCPSGPAEIIHHGIDGMLVENGNIQALANSMTKLMIDDELRLRLSINALESAKAYQIDNIIDQWSALLERVD